MQEILSSDSRVLVLGGDHSVTVGSVDGHIRSKGDIGLLYVDAHADLNTADTSPSGNVHGMSVALLVKELHDYWPYLPGMDWQTPALVKLFSHLILPYFLRTTKSCISSKSTAF